MGKDRDHRRVIAFDFDLGLPGCGNDGDHRGAIVVMLFPFESLVQKLGWLASRRSPAITSQVRVVALSSAALLSLLAAINAQFVFDRRIDEPRLRTLPRKQHTLVFDLGLEMLRRRQGRRGRNLYQVGEPGASSAFVQYRHSVSDLGRGILCLQFRGRGYRYSWPELLEAARLSLTPLGKGNCEAGNFCGRIFAIADSGFEAAADASRAGMAHGLVVGGLGRHGPGQINLSPLRAARKSVTGLANSRAGGMGTPGVPQETSTAQHQTLCISGNSSRHRFISSL